MKLICDHQTCQVVASGKLAEPATSRQQFLLLKPLFDQLTPETKRRMKLMIKKGTVKLKDYTMTYLTQLPEQLQVSLSIMDYFALHHAKKYGTKLLCSYQWYQTVSQHLSLNGNIDFNVYKESVMVFESPVFETPTVTPASSSVVLILLNFSQPTK